MSYSLIIFDNPVLENIFSLNLKVYTGTDVLSKTSAEEVCEFLKAMPSIELVVAKEKVLGKEAGSTIFQFIKENELNIPVIIFGNSAEYDKTGDFDRFGTFLTTNTDVRTFVRTCARHLGITSKDIASKIVPDYLPIPIDYLEKYEQITADLYSKASKANEPLKFERLFNKGEAFTNDLLHELKEQGQKNLYIKSNNRVDFVNQYTQQMLPKVLDSVPEEQMIQVMETTTAILLEQVREVGVSEATLAMADKTISKMKDVAKNTNKLTDFLDKLFSDTDSYAYKHSQIMSYLCFHMLDKLEWGSDEHQDNLAFSSLFKDMMLKSDDLMKITNDEQMEEANLSDELEHLVRNHAQMAATILQQSKDIPYMSDVIIRQHHGSKMGVGFPKELPQDLTRLSVVFFVAHKYADNLLKEDSDNSKLSHQDMIFYLYERYTHKSFQETIKTLGWMFLKEN
jgi:HD-GYP domain-containing protein (c-di-GMP phosphodiesterase class II)